MKASLYIRVRIDGRYLTTKPAYTAKGHIRPGFALVGGEPQKFDSVAYVLRYGSTWETIGPDANDALIALDRKNHQLKAAKLGFEVEPQTMSVSAPGRSLSESIAKYLEDTEKSKKPGTHGAYEIALRYFADHCKKSTLEQVDRDDLLTFADYLKDKKGQSDRSTYNKFKSVMTFFRAMGITSLLRKGDRPRYTETDVEIYEQPDLERFFSACTTDERLLFQFFLFTGMREMEAAHTAWSDLNFDQSTVKVTAKPEWKWSPKNRKERGIPVPSSLMSDLKAIQPAGRRGLIFGKKPKTTFLDDCKDIAVRAGLDPDTCWLHKFRATFCTMHLRAGVDLSTVQKWMGHTDLASTMRYLKPAEGPEVQAKVNATFSNLTMGSLVVGPIMKCLLFLVMLLSTFCVNAQTSPTCVPFQLIHHQIIVKVTIADQGSYPFLLDTGAQTTVVGPSIAQSLHLPTGGVVDVSGFGSKIQTPWSRTSIEVAGQRKSDVGVLIYDAAQIQKRGDASIYGVLGANFLEGYTITLDYKNSCISLQ